MAKCYRHILIPLDGSELAEMALEDALTIARLCQAHIILLQVLLPFDQLPQINSDYPIYLDQILDSKKMLALQYLQSIRKRVWTEELTINLAVKMGPPAETIIDYAQVGDIDLIVMATHGRSGLSRWVYGSVADKVLRGANVPVLLVRAYAKPKAGSTHEQAEAEGVLS